VIVTKNYTLNDPLSHATFTLACEDSTDYTVTKKDAPRFTVIPDTVCNGDNAKLSIQSIETGISYNWDWKKATESTFTGNQLGGSNLTIPAVKEPHSVKVTGTKESCPHDTTVAVNVHQLPNIADFTPVSVCIGKDTAFTPAVTFDMTYNNQNGVADNGYAWAASKDANSMITPIGADGKLNVSPKQTGVRTYTLTVTDKNGCVNSNTAELTVSAKPNINIAGNTYVCPNTQTTLSVDNSANTFKSIKWYADTMKTQEIGTGTTFSPNIKEKDTTFYVAVNVGETDGIHCEEMKEVAVRVKPMPKITANGVKTICKGGSTRITLIGNSGGTYKWLGNAAQYGNSADVTLNPTVTTQYQVEATTSDGCLVNVKFDITVNELPIVLINGKKAGDTTVCLGYEVPMAKGGNANEYQWSNRTTNDTYTPKPNANTNYWLVGTNTTTGCKDTARFNVKVAALPIVQAEGDIYECKGKDVTLSVKNPETSNPQITYSWYVGDTTSANLIGTSYNKVVKADSSVTYIVKVQEVHNITGQPAFACASTSTQRLIVKDNPKMQLTPDTSVCENNYITLTATSPSATFHWEEANSANSSINVQIKSDTVFHVTATKNGCSSDSFITVRKLALPTLKAAEIDTICYNTAANLSVTASGGNGSGYIYEWDSHNINVANGSTATTVLLTNTMSTYKFPVKVTDGKGCVGKDTALVNVKALPAITIEGDKYICEGSSKTYTSKVVNGTAPNTYQWIENTTNIQGATNASYNVTMGTEDTKTISLRVTTSRGCENVSEPFIIHKWEKPTLSIIGDTILCNGESTTIRVAGAGSDPSKYVWNGNGLNNANGLSQTFRPTTGQTGDNRFIYSLKGTDKNGCEKDTTFSILVHQRPIVHLTTTNTDICEKGQTSLLATTAVPATNIKYEWNTGESNTNQTGSHGITISPSQTTEYRILTTNTET
jgi:hypothetical protein